MKTASEQVLCRFQLSNFIRHGMSPLYEWIVETAHRLGLQGATILKGFMGLRSDGSIIEENPWALAQEVPVIVEVVDDGVGMPKATLDHLFDPFFSTKSRERGLGMAMVKSLVSRHGGRILVESAPLRGTEVRLLLPEAPIDPEDEE